MAKNPSKQFYEINQVAKALTKDTLYVMVDSKTIITTNLTHDETNKIVTINFDKDIEVPDKPICINGKLVYSMYKEKIKEIMYKKKSIELITNDGRLIIINDEYQLKKDIIKKYKRFPQFDMELVSTYDFTDIARDIYKNKILYDEYVDGIRVNITKKLLSGYKDGKEVILNIYSTANSDILFIMELNIYRPDINCNISNKYLILNY